MDSDVRRAAAGGAAVDSQRRRAQRRCPRSSNTSPIAGATARGCATTTCMAWIAAQGYVCARVDITGSGDSDGLLRDEYLKQEQDDACEIIAWLAKQPWCSGNVGMIGISWGGFNGLQAAFRQPPALKAVITCCSTVDRYADDVHYMGGCLLSDNMDWGGAFFSVAGVPPDPADGRAGLEGALAEAAGDPAALSGALARSISAATPSGSMARSARITASSNCAILAVGGWADGYTAAVFRLVENLKRPDVQGHRRPLGPSLSPARHSRPGHRLPAGMQALVGPLAEGQAERRRERPGAAPVAAGLCAAEVALRPPARPLDRARDMAGRQASSARAGRSMPTGWRRRPARRRRSRCARRRPPASPTANGVPTASARWRRRCRSISASTMPARWCSTPRRSTSRCPARRRSCRASRASPSTGRMAFVCVRLSDVAPDGQVTKVTYGLLNLTHRDEPAPSPSKLEPGRRYQVKVRLNEIAHRLRARVTACASRSPPAASRWCGRRRSR